MRRLIAAAFALVLFALPGTAAEADHHTRRLTAAERAAILPLLCERPVAGKDGDTVCAHLVGYPGEGRPGATLSLDAIAYGSFSQAGADEAYVSYGSDAEPHANNFGGGVLLARSGERWRIVRWYPGGQMETCVALPGGGKQAMLCLAGWMGMGETDSSVWVKRLPFEHDEAVLKAQDQRGLGHDIAPDACAARRAVLLSIDALKRAEDPQVLAAAAITYATRADLARACRSGAFEHVKETKGEARFVLRGGKVKALTPVPFAPTDY